QLHRMPKRLQQPRPMMARTTGLDRDRRWRQLLKESHHFLAAQLLAQNGRFTGIHTMKLENVLRRIHPNSDNLVHGRSPFSEISNGPQSGTIDAVGGRPHQQSKIGGFVTPALARTVRRPGQPSVKEVTSVASVRPTVSRFRLSSAIR